MRSWRGWRLPALRGGASTETRRCVGSPRSGACNPRWKRTVPGDGRRGEVDRRLTAHARTPGSLRTSRSPPSPERRTPSPARTARSSAPGRSPASVAFSWERSGTSSSARSSRSDVRVERRSTVDGAGGSVPCRRRLLLQPRQRAGRGRADQGSGDPGPRGGCPGQSLPRPRPDDDRRLPTRAARVRDLDVFWGTRAVRDTFPLILAELDKRH